MIESNIQEQISQIEKMGNKAEFVVLSVNAYECLSEEKGKLPTKAYGVVCIVNPYQSDDVVVLSDCVTELRIWNEV